MSAPTKKFAPVVDSNAICPHSYSDDEGVQVEIDCLECAGANDLTNRKCLTGVLNLISGGVDPKTIILKRYTHRRYRGDVVRRATSIAAELASLNRSVIAAETTSDKRCRTCPASSEKIAGELKRRLLDDPAGYVSSLGAIVKDIESASYLHACDRARTCVQKGLSASLLQKGR